MRKNTGVNLTQAIRNYIYSNPGCSKYDLVNDLGFPYSKMRMPISKLKNNGEIIIEDGKYNALESIAFLKDYNHTSEEFSRRGYLKKLVDVVIVNIHECTDHNIKIQYIQEGRRLLKDLK